MRQLLIVLMVLSLVACGTAQTVVIEPPATDSTFASVSIIENQPAVEVPPEVKKLFEQELMTGLFEKGSFTPGNDMKLMYTFTGQNSGNRFARWFWGGIGNYGKGSITIDVSYVGSSGNQIAKTQVEGQILAGFLGGSFDEAVKKAAQDIANYTVTNFK